MSWPTGGPSENVTVSPYYDGTADPQPSYQFQYQWPAFETEPCSCGRTTRHLWLTHWFRLFYMKERW